MEMGNRVRSRRVLVVCAASLMAGAGFAEAATYKPTRFDDPVPGNCKPDNCSLREAFLKSNATSAKDTIVLDKGRYEMELPRASGFGQDGLWWTYGSTVRGEGSGKTILDANLLDAAMQLGNGPESSRLEGLKITGGVGPANETGGVLGVGRKMTLDDVEVSGNQSGTGAGGAFLAPAISVRVVDSTFKSNSTTGKGGGLFLGLGSSALDIKATIKGSRIIDNAAFFGAGIYSQIHDLKIQKTTIAGNDGTEGGGLDLVSSFGVAPLTKIDSTTISENTALKGGGLLIDGNQPTTGLLKPQVDITNSTIAANDARADGGGILADNQAAAVVTHSTISHNLADADATGGGVAGGAYQHSGASLEFRNSLVGANEVGPSGTAPQCAGTMDLITAGNVFQLQSGGCTFSGNALVASDVGIQGLADNGGPTETIALRGGSPAVALADDCLKRDQRGVKRSKNNCDAGAFERP